MEDVDDDDDTEKEEDNYKTVDNKFDQGIGEDKEDKEDKDDNDAIGSFKGEDDWASNHPNLQMIW